MWILIVVVECFTTGNIFPFLITIIDLIIQFEYAIDMLFSFQRIFTSGIKVLIKANTISIYRIATAIGSRRYLVYFFPVIKSLIPVLRLQKIAIEDIIGFSLILIGCIGKLGARAKVWIHWRRWSYFLYLLLWYCFRFLPILFGLSVGPSFFY